MKVPEDGKTVFSCGPGFMGTLKDPGLHHAWMKHPLGKEVVLVSPYGDQYRYDTRTVPVYSSGWYEVDISGILGTGDERVYINKQRVYRIGDTA